MTEASFREGALELVSREARYLDRRLWDEWLELFLDDAVFWVPAWKDEENQTADPDREVSMMYYDGRIRLAERIWRARSGQSLASTPLHRTMHTISTIALERCDDVSASVSSNWSTHIFDPKDKSQHVLFGFYEHELTHSESGWKISRKKIVVLNDYLPITIDFYDI
ncbi:MAG TPA: aromatic-ring-hydroxylating dioxygenase subunit beta [Allosphingosinicella sp.]|nr:aromatic-ring-hydroxylating dioxygenase subunit beta [Allosphingosinicella sp.]